MIRHLPLLAIVLFACAASFGPVVFRSWVLQHDIDGGWHTISNAVFVGDGSGLTGITGGGETVWTNSEGTVEILGPATNQVYVSRTNIVNADYAVSVEGWATGNGQPSIFHAQMNDAGTPFTGLVSEVAQFINNTTGFGTLTNGGKIFNLSGSGQFGLTGDVESGTYNLDDQGAGVRGVNEGGNAIAIGVLGISSDAPGIDGQSVIGIAASAFGTRSYSNLIGEFIQLSTTASPPQPVLQNAALLIDNTSSAVPLIVARTNNGTIVFSVTASGLASSAAGFSSTDTTAAVAIAATGWTNTLGKLTRVFFNGTAMTYTVKDSAGSPYYTNAVALTGSEMIILQASEALTISGTGVAGVRKPL